MRAMAVWAAVVLCGCDFNLSLPPAFETDSTAPSFANPRLTPTAATRGTPVVFHFSTSEAVEAAPSLQVKVAGVNVAADCTANGLDVSCPFTVDAPAFAEGNGAIEVRATDLAGNASEPWLPALALRIDYTAPTITLRNAPLQVPQSTVLSFDVHPTEPLGLPPNIAVMPAASAWLNSPFSCSPATGDDFTCSATILGSAPFGTYTFGASGADVAGNRATSASSTVEVISAVAPISLRDALVTPSFSRGGQPVAVTFASAELITQCTVRLGSATGPTATSCQLAPNFLGCTCVLVIPTSGYEGPTTVLLDATNGSRVGHLETSVAIDLTAPVVTPFACTLLRSPVGTSDVVSVALAQLFDPIDGGTAFAQQGLQTVRLWGPDGGALLLAFDAGVDSVLVPDSIGASPQRVWCSALDTAGNESPKVLAINEDTAPPQVTSSSVVLTRNPVGTPDTVHALPGGIADAVSPLATFELRDGNNALLATGAYDGGGFGPVPVGSGTSAPKLVFLVATDKNGNATASQPVAGGDQTAPQLATGGAFIERRDAGVPDRVSLVNAYLPPGCVTASVRLARTSTGAAEVTWTPFGPDVLDMGTATNAPQRVWATATDKCGNTSSAVEIMAGADTVAPTTTASAASFVRNPVGQLDRVQVPVGTFPSPGCAVVTVELQPGDGGTESYAAPGPSSPIDQPVGTPTSAPRSVMLRPIDKCGNGGTFTQVPPGGDLSAPAVDTSKVGITRTPVGSVDSALSQPGAITGAPCAPVSVTLTNAAGGSFLDGGFGVGAAVTDAGTLPVLADGTFLAAAVGHTTLSLPALYLTARDKCGNVGPVTAGQLNADLAAPTVNASLLTVIDRVHPTPFDGGTGPDEIFGSAGAVSDAVSGPAMVVALGYADLFAYTSGGYNMVTTAALLPSGALPSVAVAPTSRYVGIAARDKAGNWSPSTTPGHVDLALSNAGATGTGTCCPDSGRVTLRCVRAPGKLSTASPVRSLMLRTRLGDVGKLHAADGQSWDCTGSSVSTGGTWLSTPDATGTPRRNAALGYYPWLDMMIVLGGRDVDGNPVTEARSCSGGWFIHAYSGVPTREGAATATEWCGDSLFVFGGLDSTGTPTRQVDEFTRESGTPYWRRHPDNPFSTMAFSTATSDCSSGQRLFTLTGGTSDARVYTFNADTGVWTVSSPAPAPPVMTQGAWALDPVSSQVVLFGGAQGPTPLGDLYRYAGGAFTQLNPSPSPSARAGPSAITNPYSRALHWAEGETASGPTAENWRFYNQSTSLEDGGTAAAGSWHPAAPSPTPAAGSSGAWGVGFGACTYGGSSDGGLATSPGATLRCYRPPARPTEQGALLTVELPFVGTSTPVRPQFDFTGMAFASSDGGAQQTAVRLLAWTGTSWRVLGEALGDGGTNASVRFTGDAGVMSGGRLFFAVEHPTSTDNNDSAARVSIDHFELRVIQ
ncbi:MAG: hypothetical protein JNG84_02850 [Archangium sp.]|nr:hypothetical protein [Archangium sp.]